MQVAKLKHDDIAKSRNLRKSLEHITDSVRLWKAVIELADEKNARVFRGVPLNDVYFMWSFGLL